MKKQSQTPGCRSTLLLLFLVVLFLHAQAIAQIPLPYPRLSQFTSATSLFPVQGDAETLGITVPLLTANNQPVGSVIAEPFYFVDIRPRTCNEISEITTAGLFLSTHPPASVPAAIAQTWNAQARANAGIALTRSLRTAIENQFPGIHFASSDPARVRQQFFDSFCPSTCPTARGLRKETAYRGVSPSEAQSRQYDFGHMYVQHFTWQCQ